MSRTNKKTSQKSNSRKRMQPKKQSGKSSSKKSRGRVQGVKKDLHGAPNQDTFNAGLTLNVNHVRNGMRDFFSNTTRDELPKFSGSHIALTACLEKMTSILIDACKNRLHEGDNGLKTFHCSVLKFGIYTSSELRSYFERKMRFEYKGKKNDYSGSVPLELGIKHDRNELMKFINKIDDKINFTPECINLFHFLLGKTFTDITYLSHQFMLCSNKKYLKPIFVRYAVNNTFEPKLAKQLINSINRAIDKALSARPKSESKKNKSKKKTQKIDSEDDDNSYDEGSDDEESDDDDLDDDELDDDDLDEEMDDDDLDEEMDDDDLDEEMDDDDLDEEIDDDDLDEEMDDDDLDEEIDDDDLDEEIDDDLEEDKPKKKKTGKRKGTRNSRHRQK